MAFLRYFYFIEMSPAAHVTIVSTPKRKRLRATQHPMARPNFLCRPDRVKGIPIFREIRLFAPEIPRARFQENENPNFLPMGGPHGPSNHFWAEMSMKIFSSVFGSVGEDLAGCELVDWGVGLKQGLQDPSHNVVKNW